MKNSVKKQCIFYIALAISLIFVLLIAYYQLKISDKTYTLEYRQEEFAREQKQEMKDLNTGTRISKKFVAKKNYLEKIRVEFSGTVGNSANIIIQLIDLTDNLEIANKTIRTSDLEENDVFFLEFNKQDNSKNKTYAINIDFVENADSKVTIPYVEKNLNNKSTTTINGKQIDGTLAINEYYQDSSKQKLFNMVAITASLVAIIVAIFIFLKKDISVEKVFLYTIPIMCLMFLVIMPMFKSHDEQRHWLRAYEVSEGHIFTQVHNNKVESYLPKNVVDPLDTYWRDITYDTIRKSTNVSLDNDKKEYTDMSYVAVYSPIQYIPQAIGIALTRIFTDNVLMMAYSARVTNLLFALLIMYFAIKTTPIGKKAFLLLSMLPLSIEAFSSMSPDAMTISIAFLFIAYIFKMIYEKEKKVNKKDIVIITILSIIIALCKIVYIPLVGLLILLPKEKFRSGKRKWITVTLIILLAITLNLTWLFTANQYLSLSSEGVSGGQISYILKNPIEYIKIFLYSLNVNGQRYLTSLFGGELGWNEFSLYFFVPYIYCALFIFVSITDKTETKLGKLEMWKKVIMLLIVLAIFALIFTSLYVQWTSPEDTSIKGVQGRYFIPFMPLVAILLESIKITTKYKEISIIKTIAITGMILHVYVLLSIVINHL